MWGESLVESAISRDMPAMFWRKLVLSFLLATLLHLGCGERCILGSPGISLFVAIAFLCAAIISGLIVNAIINSRLRPVPEAPIAHLLRMVYDIYAEDRQILKEFIAGNWKSSWWLWLYCASGLFLFVSLIYSTYVGLTLFSDSIRVEYVPGFMFILSGAYLFAILVKHERFSPTPIIKAEGNAKTVTDALYRGVMDIHRTNFFTRVCLEFCNIILWTPISLDFPQITARDLLVYVNIKGQDTYNSYVEKFFRQMFHTPHYVVEFHCDDCLGGLFAEGPKDVRTVRCVSDLFTKPPMDVVPYLFDSAIVEGLDKGIRPPKGIRFVYVLVRDKHTRKPLVQMYIQKLRAAYIHEKYLESKRPKDRRDRERLHRLGKKYFERDTVLCVEPAYAFLIHMFGDFGLIEHFAREISMNTIQVSKDVISLSLELCQDWQW